LEATTSANANGAAAVNPSSDLDVKIVVPRQTRRKKPRAGGANQTTESPLEDENLEELEEEIELKYGAQHVIKLFIPVTLCLLFVILSLSFIKSYQKSDGATLYLNLSLSCLFHLRDYKNLII
jgi:hypothetical protein